MSGRIRAHLRNNVIGYLALFLVVSGGTAYATHPGGANTISSGDIINGEVKTGDIGDLEVRAADIAADSLGGGKIANQSVKNADLSIGASSSNTIADGGIQGVDVKNNTLTGGQIDESTLFNDNSLTGNDIDESTLSSIGGGGPAGGDLTGTYPNPDIADAAVTIPKLAFDPATQSELNAHKNSGDHDDRYWTRVGNTGTTAGKEFLGTTDDEPLELHVNATRALRLEPASDGTNQSPNVIGGIADNAVTAGVHSATIGGGGRRFPEDPASANRVTDNGGTVGGGAENRAGDGAGTTSDRTFATVGGGIGNDAISREATVGGGGFNTATASDATVGGGFANNATGTQATVGGGGFNNATALIATVGGGRDNDARGEEATVAGGHFNTASGIAATVGGGNDNTASGAEATVPGGTDNTALGANSFAAGRRAQANHTGAFVWADSSNFDFASTADNQFSARSTGGARFVSAINATTGAPTAGVTLAPGGGSWSSLSDAASKRAVEPVSGLEVLRRLDSVPISTWSYLSQDDSTRHIGPMAQDFVRAFGVGEDRRHIASVDADGVALAAIKGLNRKLHRKLRAERHRIDRLETRLAALERDGR